MTYNYVIIGGGIAGTNAAFGIRKNDPEGSILIIGEEPFSVYSRVSLGKIVYAATEAEGLMLKNPDQYDKQLIDTLFGKRVEEVDFPHKLLTLSDGSHIGYNKLLIATGGRARKLQIPGSDLEGVFSFQSLVDAMKSAQYIENKDQILVIGGGFIGIEFVDILSRLGKKITLVIREPWYWSKCLLKEGGELLHDYISSRAEVIYETELDSIQGENGLVTKVTLSNGKTKLVDAVYAGIGIEMNHELFNGEFLKKNRGILTNEFLQTSLKDVYAAGDIAEYYDIFLKKYVCGGTWVVASMQGMIAGHNMTHPTQLKPFEMVPSFAPKIPLPVSFVGSIIITPDVEVEIARNDGGHYIQLHFKNNVIIGAAMINESAMMGRLQQWIKQRMSKTESINEIKKII